MISGVECLKNRGRMKIGLPEKHLLQASPADFLLVVILVGDVHRALNDRMNDAVTIFQLYAIDPIYFGLPR
jgi:hypothetical protein